MLRNPVYTGFQSTRPVRGETPGFQRMSDSDMISIHSPRAGRDLVWKYSRFARNQISIHSPRAGRDLPFLSGFAQTTIFQSTRPVRGETLSHVLWHVPLLFQSTRPVRGETLKEETSHFSHGSISIHSPRAGRDKTRVLIAMSKEIFQSTRPVRGETIRIGSQASFLFISIHSPRAGRDHVFVERMVSLIHFNPLAPCGARPALIFSPSAFNGHFNPLAPCGARRRGFF